MKTKNQQPSCTPVYRTVDTRDNDQASDPTEGVAALFELRRLGALPPEPVETEWPDWAELCF